MALFTDGVASNIEDLTAQDSQLLQVSSQEGIDLTVKLGLTHEAVGIELEELLSDRGEAVDLSRVVVTPPLRLWHTYRTLEAVYRDAYHNQMNDRYGEKRDEYREMAKGAQERLRKAGLGIARLAIPRAVAPELRAGVGSLADGTYYVTMAWVDGRGEEGAAATPAPLTTSGGGFVVVPGPPPGVTIAWNVYVGTAPESVARQNSGPIDCDSPWAQTEPLRNGPGPSDGQRPHYFQPMPRVIQRG